MSISETYCILLLAVLGIATAITVAATLHSIYRKESTAQIWFTKDGRRQLFEVSPTEMEKSRAILAQDLRHRKHSRSEAAVPETGPVAAD
jgi:hypothetical protein